MKLKPQFEHVLDGRTALVLVRYKTTPFVKLIEVRQRVSLQIDQSGHVLGVTHFIAQKRKRSSLNCSLRIAMTTGTGGTSLSFSWLSRMQNATISYKNGVLPIGAVITGLPRPYPNIGRFESRY